MTIDLINVGTVADDGTGDPLRDAFIKTNANDTDLQSQITTLSASIDSANNVIVVNSLADFPAPVGGIIELTSGADITYLLDTEDINIGANRFTCTGGSCNVIGSSRFASRITSSTIQDLFTANTAGLSLEFMSVDSPLSPYLVNFAGNGNQSFVFNNAVVIACKKIFTIAGAFTTSLRTLAVVSTSIGGMEWTGTASSQINMTNSFGLSWSGTLLDLGTATFDLIVISSDNRFISPIGTTILSAGAANANIKIGGRALVSGTIFNGLGTTLAGGITTQDTKWSFFGNTFAGTALKNTLSSTKGFISAPTSAPTAAAGSGVFVAVGGANWTTNDPKRWTVSTAGIMTYIGLDDMSFFISHHSAGEPASGGAQKMQTQLYVNGSLEAETIGEATDSNTAQMAGDGIFSMSTGGTVQLFAAIIGSVNIDFDHCGVTALVSG
jgi:hypothetical protein